MTYKDFKRRVREIESQEFKGTCFHPLEFGIERTIFDENKLKKLIALAKTTTFATAKRRIETWERQIERVRSTRERLQQGKAGIFVRNRDKAKKAVRSAETLRQQVADRV